MTRLQDPSSSGDCLGDMRTIRLDPDTADRLLAGAVAPDDAPPGYAGVAQLLHTARRGTVPEPAEQEATVAAMQAAVLSSPSASRVQSPTNGRRRMVSKALAAKAAAATTVVLLGAGSAAAVSGSLSGGSPHTASHPGGASAHSSGGISTGSTTNTPKSGDPSGTSSILTPGVSKRQGNGPSPNALPGLCRAKIASAGHPNAHSVVAMVNCAGVTPAGGGQSSTAAPAHPTGPATSTTSGTPAGGPSAGSPPGNGAGGGGGSSSAHGAGHH